MNYLTIHRAQFGLRTQLKQNWMHMKMNIKLLMNYSSKRLITILLNRQVISLGMWETLVKVIDAGDIKWQKRRAWFVVLLASYTIIIFGKVIDVIQSVGYATFVMSTYNNDANCGNCSNTIRYNNRSHQTILSFCSWSIGAIGLLMFLHQFLNAT